ncbi:MAG: M67 family metallopeptidase [Gemmatimonadota bacterium]|nr:MAG: M67 family metallopeptidase [Gemmatimonadota bacterium]
MRRERPNASLDLRPPERRTIREHAARNHPEEACGALLGQVSRAGVTAVHAAIPLANEGAERTRRYLIGPAAVLQLERRAEELGLKVVGYYHSHPDAPAVPSEADREHAWPWYVYLIAGTSKRGAPQWSAWRLTGDRRRFRRLAIGAGDRLEGGSCTTSVS